MTRPDHDCLDDKIRHELHAASVIARRKRDKREARFNRDDLEDFEGIDSPFPPSSHDDSESPKK